jgi:hypothetical protein
MSRSKKLPSYGTGFTPRTDALDRFTTRLKLHQQTLDSSMRVPVRIHAGVFDLTPPPTTIHALKTRSGIHAPGKIKPDKPITDDEL